MSRWWGWYEPRRPREVKGGIKSRSRGGHIGESWWSKRWIEVLDSFGWSNRLQRGRNYARRGQVIDFRIESGRVTAEVQGSRPKPYRVKIALRVLGPAQWKAVTAAMASRAVFAARLLAGEVPAEIEEVFRRAKVPLFPESGRDFEADCPCPDWAEICKHIAAVHYLLAEQFDRDPFMLFALRGCAKERLLAELGKARGGETPAPAPPPPEPPEPMGAGRFWKIGPSFASARVAPSPPAVELAVLRRLGPPAFAKRRPDRLRRFERIYQDVSALALADLGA